MLKFECYRARIVAQGTSPLKGKGAESAVTRPARRLPVRNGLTPAALLLSGHPGQIAAITTVHRQPVEFRHQCRGQLDAGGIDLQAPVKDPALPGHNIEITAGDLRIGDPAIFIFKFFKAAQAAPFTECVPCLVIIVVTNHRAEVSLKGRSGPVCPPGSPSIAQS